MSIPLRVPIFAGLTHSILNRRKGPHMIRYYVVKGRVQGVGFRWFVHREAGARGLKGWVRNTEKGEVELMACR